jgi:hypothetical protein
MQGITSGLQVIRHLGRLGCVHAGSCQALEVIAELGEFLNAVLIIVPAIRLAFYGGGHQGLIAHLATSNERDGGGCRDHPWAVNVVHNLLDFLADHSHTNDRV